MNFRVNLTGFLRDRAQKFIYQPCVLCGRYDKLAICRNCENSFNNHKIRCVSCGIPMQKTKLDYCFPCLKSPYNFSKTYVLYDYSNWVRVLIHQFKYQQKLSIGKFFATKIADFVIDLKNYDAIIPMPLHKKRLRKRGFNQVMEILQTTKNIKIDNTSCVRIKYTKELNQLNPEERNTEIKKAFKVFKDMNYNKILIVDDIMTTTASTTELTTTILKFYKINNKSKPQIDVLILARANKK